MATQKDKERKETPAAPAANSKTTTNSKTERTGTNDPDTYNPVGMAGQKAGKVEQIEEQLQPKGGTAEKEKVARSRK